MTDIDEVIEYSQWGKDDARKRRPVHNDIEAGYAPDNAYIESHRNEKQRMQSNEYCRIMHIPIVVYGFCCGGSGAVSACNHN